MLSNNAMFRVYVPLNSFKKIPKTIKMMNAYFRGKETSADSSGKNKVNYFI